MSSLERRLALLLAAALAAGLGACGKGDKKSSGKEGSGGTTEPEAPAKPYKVEATTAPDDKLATLADVRLLSADAGAALVLAKDGKLLTLNAELAVDGDAVTGGTDTYFPVAAAIGWELGPDKIKRMLVRAQGTEATSETALGATRASVPAEERGVFAASSAFFGAQLGNDLIVVFSDGSRGGESVFQARVVPLPAGLAGAKALAGGPVEGCQCFWTMTSGLFHVVEFPAPATQTAEGEAGEALEVETSKVRARWRTADTTGLGALERAAFPLRLKNGKLDEETAGLGIVEGKAVKLTLKISGDADFAGSATSVPGGTGEDQDPPADPTAPSPAPPATEFAAVAPLFEAHCKSCHDWAGSDDGISGRYAAAKARIESGDMPPDPAVLPDADKTSLVEWLKAKLKN